MIYCNNCGAPLDDNAAFCGTCGAPTGKGAAAGQGAPVYPPYTAYVDPKDHTAEYDPKDIAENKVMAMAAYILSIPGIIIALLAAPNSPYAAFHSRQALKLEIVNILLALITAVLCWTVIVPIVGGICIAVLFVVRIICFFNVCSGKAKEAAIISNLGFLR